MIVLTNTTAQTLAAGAALAFDSVVVKTKNGCECHRENSAAVKLCQKGIYQIFFKANIGGDAGTQANLVIDYGGEPLIETTMVATIEAATDVYNVAAETALKHCCCDGGRITVTNSGTTPVVVQPNSTLYIQRLA